MNYQKCANISRREFLRLAGAAGLLSLGQIGLVYLPGCSASPATGSATSTSPVSSSSSQASASPVPIPPGLEKIEHFIFIMQENRSFDHFFGTYPGADGFPNDVALLDPHDGTLVAPYHLTSDISFNGPHDWFNAIGCINGGKMNGFLSQAYSIYTTGLPADLTSPGNNPKELMGYYDYRDLPNYWLYAQQFVLQDRMFESVSAYSLASHLYMLAAQSGGYLGTPQPKPTEYDFPEITELLANANISWRYYVTSGTKVDANGMAIGSVADQAADPNVYSLWNPLPAFPKVENDTTQRSYMVDTSQFYQDAAAGTLPSVSWITPFFKNAISDHPQFQGGVRNSMAYVTGLINAVMQGPNWNTSVVCLAWDDWGGYYDHVVPPQVDQYGYGLRVPSLLISPYAKQGYIDHNTYSFDSWLRTVEARWGIPSMTERDKQSADLMASFDFEQKPRSPVFLAATPQGSSYTTAT